MLLTVAGILIVFLTFVFKEIFKERLKDFSEAVKAAENLFLTEVGQSALAVKMSALTQQINEMQLKGRRRKKGGKSENYSEIIRQDSMLLMERRSALGASFDSVCRLLEKLPSKAKEVHARDLCQKENDALIQEATEVFKRRLATSDWGQMAKIKILIMRIAFQEIKVALLGAAVLAKARNVQKAAEKTYRFYSWVSYVLYTAGLGLGLYANLTGIKKIAGLE